MRSPCLFKFNKSQTYADISVFLVSAALGVGVALTVPALLKLGPVELSFLLLVLLSLPFLRIRRIDWFAPVIVVALNFVGFAGSALTAIFLLDFSSPDFEMWLSQDKKLSLTLFYAILGILAFYIGYYLLPNSKHKGSKPSFFFRFQTWNGKGVVIYSTVLVGLAIASTLVIISRTGWVFFLNNLHLRSVLYSEIGVFGILRWSSQISSLILLIHLYKINQRQRWFWLLFWLQLAINSFLFILFGGRTAVCLYWLSHILVYHYMCRRISVSCLLLAFVGILAITNAMITYRRTAGTGPFSVDYFIQSYFSTFSFEEDLLLTTVGGRALADIYILSDIVALVPSVYPFEFGWTFIRPFIMLIPRSLNPDKPVLTELGVYLNDLFYNHPKSGIPPSAIGELYLNFGVVGIIVGMIIFGWLCQRMYRILRQGKHNPTIILLYSLFLLYGIHQFVNGDFSQVVANIVWLLSMPVAGVFLFVVRYQNSPILGESASDQKKTLQPTST